jgi:hypothetical protein
MQRQPLVSRHGSASVSRRSSSAILSPTLRERVRLAHPQGLRARGPLRGFPMLAPRPAPIPAHAGDGIAGGVGLKMEEGFRFDGVQVPREDLMALASSPRARRWAMTPHSASRSPPSSSSSPLSRHRPYSCAGVGAGAWRSSTRGRWHPRGYGLRAGSSGVMCSHNSSGIHQADHGGLSHGRQASATLL